MITLRGRCHMRTIVYRMMLSADDVLTALLILAVVMLVIVLYHVLFIIVDLRKVMKRVESVSHEVEAIIMKPLTMTDTILEWLLQYIEGLDKTKNKKKHDHKVIDAD